MKLYWSSPSRKLCLKVLLITLDLTSGGWWSWNPDEIWESWCRSTWTVSRRRKTPWLTNLSIVCFTASMSLFQILLWTIEITRWNMLMFRCWTSFTSWSFERCILQNGTRWQGDFDFFHFLLFMSNRIYSHCLTVEVVFVKQEIVALSGAHTLGRARPDRSGWGKPETKYTV